MTAITRRLNWGTGIALVYGLFALATLAMVALAVSRPVDLVSPDYYQRSLRQDERMAAVQRAQALGTGLAITADQPSQQVLVRLPRADREVTGTVTLYRPSDSAADVRVPLMLVDGVHAIDSARLARGRWIVQVDWTAAGRTFYYESPVLLR